MFPIGPRAGRGSPFPGHASQAVGAAPPAEGGGAPVAAPAIAAVEKGAGLVFDSFDQAGVAMLGLREVVAGELPDLWAAADYAAGAGIPMERVAVIDGTVVHGPVAGADAPLYWDRAKRRFTAVPQARGLCGEVRRYAGFRHPISDHFDQTFEGAGNAVDASGPVDFALVNGRRVRTRVNADVRAFTFTLPLTLFQEVGDTITLFAPAGTPAGNTTTITSGGVDGIRNSAGELVDSLLLTPDADEVRHITLRVVDDGFYWTQDQGAGLNATVLASAIQLAHTDATDHIQAAGEALAAVREALPPALETLYDGFADGVAALTVDSNSRAWLVAERVAFTRALTAADDGRAVEIGLEYTMGDNNAKKFVPISIPAWLFRRMGAIEGAVASAADTRSIYIQRPAAAQMLSGWGEAIMHFARWRSEGNDGVWFNVGSDDDLPHLANFRCRVDLR